MWANAKNCSLSHHGWTRHCKGVEGLRQGVSKQVSKFYKLILLSLALILAISTAALAQSGGPNGKIVYIVNMGFPDYTTDIWVMDEGSPELSAQSAKLRSKIGIT